MKNEIFCISAFLHLPCFNRFCNSQINRTFAPGEMAERSIAAVLKTVDLQGSGGSNPSLSAKTAHRRDGRAVECGGLENRCPI